MRNYEAVVWRGSLQPSYSYELQVAHPFRRHGIGRFLVEKLVAIGKHWRMEKIMLTVLKGTYPVLNLVRSSDFRRRERISSSDVL